MIVKILRRHPTRRLAVLLSVAIGSGALLARAEQGVVQELTPRADGPHQLYKVGPQAPPAPAAAAAAQPAVTSAGESGSEHAPHAHGPSIELITGGGSANGAAKVGHLPIIE